MALVSMLILNVNYISAAAALKSSKARLPSSFLSVLHQLKDDDSDGDTDTTVSAAVLIPSRTMTQAQLQQVRQQLLSLPSEELEEDMDAKAVANTESKSMLLQPSTFSELASCVMATSGHLVLVASQADLERGEGLYETGLASAMEQILMTSSTKAAKLTIIVPDACDIAQAKENLMQTAESIVSNLNMESGSSSSSSLSDVFGKGVAFVKLSEQTTTALATAGCSELVTDSSTLQSQATRTSAQLLGASSKGAPADWAAASTLWTKSQQIVQDCLDSVQSSIRSTADDDESPMILNPDFGELCQAALNTAQSQMRQADKLQSGSLATELQQQRLTELEVRLHALAQTQLELQHQSSLAEFKGALSKLLISPNLAADMQGAAQKCIRNFSRAARQLTCSSTADLVGPAQQEYAKTVLEQTKTRLLAARASGKFKPLPRKGVTVGLHWLLPKPFGNDYRQEPWTVHTSQDLVYVPQEKKLMDVAPEDVAAGDWRSKVVPSPVGNDMIYMQ